MELTLLMLCGVALLVGKCYSDAIIQQCPSGQKYVSEHSDVSLTCGPCQELIDWYVDDNSDKDKKYLGECIKTACKVDNSAAFRLKVSTRSRLGLYSVLDILDFTRNNTNFVCACFRYIYSIFPPRNGYYLQSDDSCKLLLTVLAENKEPQSENMKGRIVGGVFAAVVAVAIIGTIVTVYIRRRGMFCKGKINLRSLPCPSNLCHRKKPLSQSYEVVNNSQTPVTHYMAPSGNIYTVASTTTAGDINGEYVTVSEIVENTMSGTDMDGNHQTSQQVPDKTDTKTTFKPVSKSKPTAGEPRNFSDTPDTGYMNVPQVPTDSSLGVYHIVPRDVMSAHPQPDTGENYEAVLSEDDYNVLQFEANRTEQEDQGATYHHLEHN